jgi:hypothetical protein
LPVLKYLSDRPLDESDWLDRHGPRRQDTGTFSPNWQFRIVLVQGCHWNVTRRASSVSRRFPFLGMTQRTTTNKTRNYCHLHSPG